MSRRTLSIEMPRPGVALMVLDRPPANALTVALRRRIAAAWAELRDDQSVRAIVVTGAGSRFFSAGLDLSEVRRDLSRNQEQPGLVHERIDLLRWDPQAAGLWKPIVAAINGYCVAGGWYLAQMCDVRIASETALFGIPEGRWGLPATFTWSLPRFMPLNVALEAVLWSGRRFTAQRLHGLGWLNEVVAPKRLRDVALDWAAEIASLPPAAVQAHKQMLYATALAGEDELKRAAQERARGLYDAAGVGTGIDAFLAGPSSLAEVG